MNKKHFDSKKWVMSLIGLSCVMLIYISGVITMILSKENGANIVSLANIAITFFGTLVSIYLVGQSAVEWKVGSNINLNSTSEHKVDERIIKNINIEKGSNIKDKDYKV